MSRVVSVLLLSLVLALPVHAQVAFGGAVAIGGGEVLIAEPGNLVDPGVVYVYRPASAGWEVAEMLHAGAARDGDGFGAALAVHGELLAVGADQVGAVYVFERDGSSWRETATLTVDGAVAGKFGAAVAIAGGAVAVGAPAHDGGRGAVYVFAPDGGRWDLVATLVGDGLEPGAEGSETPEGFGSALAGHGDELLVGAPGPARDFFLFGGFGGALPNGSAYVFARGEAGWSRSDKLAAGVGGENTVFGFSVALTEGRAMVGATGADGAAGAVHVFAREGEGGWRWTGRLAPFDSRPGSFFGAALAIDGDDAYVGAPGAGSGRLEGRLYRYRRGRGGEWSGASKISTTGLKWGATYGASVAAGDGLLVAGLPGDDYGAGTAVIMTALDDGWDRSRVMSGVRGLEAITGGAVECVDGMAAIFPCDNVDLIAFLPVHEMGGGRGVTTNDLWGWTDPETDRDYAVVGLRDGTAFVDVTDPLNPVFVGKLPKPDASPASLWRDVKVHANHAFVVADASGAHGVQVFDLTRLRAFDGEPLLFSHDAHYDRVNSSHNININEETSFAYAVGNSSGGETCGGALHMINVEDPRNPMFAGCYEPFADSPRGPGGTHDVQCVTYEGPDARYSGRELCFSSDGRAFSIGDVTDKRNPRLVAQTTYPNLAYTHQGWLDDEHRYFYMNDEGDEFSGLVEGTRTLIWDVQDLEDPILVGEYTTDNPATDHNLYVVGDVMYQSNYRSGLRVVDISDRENLRALGYFDTVPWGEDDGMGDILSGAIGSWSNYPFFKSGIVAVTSGKEGLFILRLREASERP